MEFVRLDPPPTACPGYTMGCCWDYHFDMSEVLPDRVGMTACNSLISSTRRAEDHVKTTTDKKLVNCKECLEMLHA